MIFDIHITYLSPCLLVYLCTKLNLGDFQIKQNTIQCHYCHFSIPTLTLLVSFQRKIDHKKFYSIRYLEKNESPCIVSM